jgi:hypothetical protein
MRDSGYEAYTKGLHVAGLAFSVYTTTLIVVNNTTSHYNDSHLLAHHHHHGHLPAHRGRQHRPT